MQGVGFRPYVHALATSLELAGFVRNDGGRVWIEVEGTPARVEEFARRLEPEAPRHSAIEAIQQRQLPPSGEREFRIAESTDQGGSIRVAPDLAPCAQCLAEVFDRDSRRFGYPFSSCTRCGPRLTIVRGAPYDRATTTLAGFPLCDDCRREYEDPADRRFHAEAIACPRCGPRLSMPVADAAQAIREGKIVAIKGAGGFHLACDARDAGAVQRLRLNKAREEKPFALMADSLESARALCVVSDADAAALESPVRPIVLMPARDVSLPGVADGFAELGVMLPPTLLHALLAAELPGVPLVMTSGNKSDEPIAYRDDDARERLAGLADVFLTHDRPIHLRCDDSIVRGPAVLRRSRGLAPAPLTLRQPLKVPTLATGGMLKGAFALGEGRTAQLSHHLGDLDHPEAFDAFVAAVEHYRALYRIDFRRIATDLHPDYPTTRWAQEQGLKIVGVQHHHAHVASALAEHRLDGPVTAVAFDGSGFGTDGTLWGGEIFSGNAASLERVMHLSAVPLAGGDRAARQPWRVALMRLREAGLPFDALAARLGDPTVRTVLQMADRGVNSPLTSSAGRLFDAVSCLLGLGDVQSFEGQAAMKLEALARTAQESGHYPIDGGDVRPIIRALVDDKAGDAVRARRFHASLAQLIAAAAERIGHKHVTLTGGVFQNVLLASETTALLQSRGFIAITHRSVPCNDGGLCLGQLAVTAALDAQGSH